MRNRYLSTIIIIALALELFVGVAGAQQPSNAASNVTVVANFTASPTTGYSPLDVRFIDQSQNATSRLWNFGDGTYSREKKPVHKYSKAGKYTISLTAKKGKVANTLTKKNYIIVNKLKPPVAAFSAYPTKVKPYVKVRFTDGSTGIHTYHMWSFGDRQYSTAPNPKHYYSKQGKYTVTLTVRNAAGSSTKKIKNYITVKK